MPSSPRFAPGPLRHLSQAKSILDDFGISARQEDDPDAKRQLLQLVFERAWLDEGHAVAVRPKPSFAPFFQGVRKKKAAETASQLD